MKWNSYLANEHSEQIFLQLNLLFRASTLQNTSSASNVNSKCGKKKGKQELNLLPFYQQPQPSSQAARIWPHCILGNLTYLWAGKSTSKQFAIFWPRLWPALNLAPKVVQALSTFDETSTNADWSLVRQGPFALRPLVHEQQTASSSNRAFEQSLSHSQCQ